MEMLASFTLGLSLGVWATIFLFRLRRLPDDTPSVQGPVQKPSYRPFGTKKKNAIRVNNDEKAWKIENKREV